MHGRYRYNAPVTRYQLSGDQLVAQQARRKFGVPITAREGPGLSWRYLGFEIRSIRKPKPKAIPSPKKEPRGCRLCCAVAVFVEEEEEEGGAGGGGEEGRRKRKV